MKIERPLAILLVVLGALAPGAPASEAGSPGSAAADRVHVSAGSDARAIAIAQTVVERMGGWDAWDRTRYLSWKFFGRRQHYWDRWSGDVRIEGTVEDRPMLWLMNVDSGKGRVWRDGEEIAPGDELDTWLDKGRQIWVNDSYWLIMPFKMLDPGVTLRYAGERALPDGRVADVLELTFGEGVGYTPDNRYEVFVARHTGLVEQWSFFAEASEDEPRFTLPWEGWRQFGGIRIATGHGRGEDWDIAVHDALPESVFRDPAPVGGGR